MARLSDLGIMESVIYMFIKVFLIFYLFWKIKRLINIPEFTLVIAGWGSQECPEGS